LRRTPRDGNGSGWISPPELLNQEKRGWFPNESEKMEYTQTGILCLLLIDKARVDVIESPMT